MENFSTGEMGPQRGRKQHREEQEEEEEMETARAMVFLSSSDDDEEANLDLSLEIVERAKRKREVDEEASNNKQRASLEPPATRAPAVIDLSSTEEEAEAVERRSVGGTGETRPTATTDGSKRKKRKRKKKHNSEADEVGAGGGGSEASKADVAVANNEDEIMGITDSIVTDANDDVSDNIVLRKLLRGPRYFAPGSTRWESCYNCGEEGHMAADCTAEKRKKPCFVCGMFGHNAHKCTQGQECFICKRRGHFAKDCPDKRRRIPQDNTICLRCGDMGHDMSLCGNGYPSDDLKKIQCYVCKGLGHFCCVDFIDTAPREIFCYNCGDSGHSGVGCAKPRGESIGVASPTLCYICGEEGHFARGCTKKSKHGEPSTSTPKSSKSRATSGYSKNKKDFWGSKSLPRDFGQGSKSLPYSDVRKKKSMHYEGRRNTNTGKSKIKGGWIVDDPGDLTNRDRGSKPWKSPKNKSWRSPSTPGTPVRKSYKYYNSAGSSRQYRVW